MNDPPSNSVLADMPIPDLADDAERQRLSPVAVAAIVRLTELWRLPDASARVLAGDVPEETWSAMKKGSWEESLAQDVLIRISSLVGIYRNLNLIFSSSLANDWPHLPNAAAPYSGRSPLDFMLEGGIPAMLDVRRHLDAVALNSGEFPFSPKKAQEGSS